MLVLSRRLGEALIIDTPQGRVRIQITDVDSRHARCRIGIDAPAEMAVLRGELLPRSPEESPPPSSQE
jgi:carbon storage regulator CsrA